MRKTSEEWPATSSQMMSSTRGTEKGLWLQGTGDSRAINDSAGPPSPRACEIHLILLEFCSLHTSNSALNPAATTSHPHTDGSPSARKAVAQHCGCMDHWCGMEIPRVVLACLWVGIGGHQLESFFQGHASHRSPTAQVPGQHVSLFENGRNHGVLVSWYTWEGEAEEAKMLCVNACTPMSNPSASATICDVLSSSSPWCPR